MSASRHRRVANREYMQRPRSRNQNALLVYLHLLVRRLCSVPVARLTSP